eukprot:CAMPEP_0197080490 /NCGR_PEP_ID=MMETSP1384-20130603/214158_1 /TAXON_ID=29189 /ORGANISM="Ammonia sp." /LENGTH=682 /DNA_ID=CAMNT_0042519377 /DNA_START=31 /DNA_END=2076 /DNA_ORIENTATION=-
MESIRTSLLKAAFAGREVDLLQTLQTLKQHHEQHRSLQNQNNEASSFIIQCIEYCSKHSNSDISGICCQILSAINVQTPVKNGHPLSITNTNNGAAKSSATSNPSSSSSSTHSNGHTQLASSSACTATTTAAPPSTSNPNLSTPAQTPTVVKKKKKPSFTQRTVSTIEEKLNLCLKEHSKLNESLICELIDFLYKSLESCRIKKSFEKIVFKSIYVCTVLSALHQIMAHSLLDLEAFEQKHAKLHNLSLHDIIKDVIHKNISISGDESNAEIYKQNINNIKAEIVKISDQPHIHKLVHIQQQIEQCLRDGADTEDSVGQIEDILLSLHRECITTKQIKVNKNILERAKGIYACIQKLQSIRKKSIIKHSKLLISAWDQVLHPKPPSVTSNNAKATNVRVDKHSGKKRRHRDIESAAKTHERDPSKKRQKTKCDPITTITSKKRTNVSSSKSAMVPSVKSKIKDAHTDSESDDGQRNATNSRLRRSARNAGKKTKGAKKDIVSGSDLYGGESEEESLSEDEQDEEIKRKEEELFLKKKERNKKRIEGEQKQSGGPEIAKTKPAAIRQAQCARTDRENASNSVNVRNNTSVSSLKESRNRGSGKTKIVVNMNMKRTTAKRECNRNESGNDSPELELSDDDTPPKVIRRSSVKQSGANKILEKFVSGYEKKGNIKAYLMGIRGMP